jgi:hypothetical protein
MTSDWFTFNTIPGAVQIADARLWGRVLLKVKRDGGGCNITLGVATGSRDVQTLPLTARMKFRTPFNPGEKVYVLIKKS